MRVGINAFDIVFGEGSGPGAGIYAVELLRHAVRLAPSTEFVVFINREAHAAGWFPTAPNCRQYVVPLDARRKWVRPLWEQVGLPRVARRLGLDVIHSPFNTCPMFTSAPPVVATVTDLAYFYYAERHPSETDLKARYYRALQPVMFRRATALVAISEFSRQELVRRLRIPAAKISVVPLGPGQSDCSAASDGVVHDDGPCLLTVSSGLLHKNLLRLIEAYAQARLPDDLPLVVVGEIPSHPRRRMVTQQQVIDHAARLGVGNRVVVSGYVAAEVLSRLYRRARAFVFPSLYEGFGLPILEAMRAGVPVVCSRSASLPEVGGDAVEYFDGEDTADMARALDRIARDDQLRASLIQAGYRRSAAFSWERVARETLRVYERAAASH